MSDSNSHRFRPPLYHQKPKQGDGRKESEANDERGREQQGWEAYRKWLSSMNGKPRGRRVPIDHSVYSWKGYHSWADRVRQSWKPDEN
jgi:hypothetical protein